MDIFLTKTCHPSSKIHRNEQAKSLCSTNSFASKGALSPKLRQRSAHVEAGEPRDKLDDNNWILEKKTRYLGVLISGDAQVNNK